MDRRILVQEITILEFFDWETGKRTFELRRMECHEPYELAEREIEIGNSVLTGRYRKLAPMRLLKSGRVRERIKALFSLLAWSIGIRHD